MMQNDPQPSGVKEKPAFLEGLHVSVNFVNQALNSPARSESVRLLKQILAERAQAWAGKNRTQYSLFD